MKYILFLAIAVSSVLFADASIVVPDGDPLSSLLSLVTNWAAMAPLAKASLAIVLLVQAFKKFVPSFKYLKAVVVVGGVAYGLVQSLVSGMNAMDSVVFVLLTSGGAVAVYELFKAPLNFAFKVKK